MGYIPTHHPYSFPVSKEISDFSILALAALPNFSELPILPTISENSSHNFSSINDESVWSVTLGDDSESIIGGKTYNLFRGPAIPLKQQCLTKLLFMQTGWSSCFHILANDGVSLSGMFCAWETRSKLMIILPVFKEKMFFMQQYCASVSAEDTVSKTKWGQKLQVFQWAAPSTPPSSPKQKLHSLFPALVYQRIARILPNIQ